MQTLRTSTPVARKTHRCMWCYGTIAPGCRYHRGTHIGDDGLYEWIACTDCDALCAVVWDWAGRPDEGIAEDSFAEWARDHQNDSEHMFAAAAYLHRRALAARPDTADGGGGA